MLRIPRWQDRVADRLREGESDPFPIAAARRVFERTEW